MRALEICIKNKTKTNKNPLIILWSEPVTGNTTRVPLPLAKHLKYFRAFLMKKNAE